MCNMLKVKEIEMNDVFTLTEMKFENTSGHTFCKDYENGFSLVLNPCEKDGIEKVKINYFIEQSELEDCDEGIDVLCDMSHVYEDFGKLIEKGILIYE